MRGLFRPPGSPTATISSGQAVHFLDDAVFRDAGNQAEDEVGERAFKIEGLFQRVTLQPYDAEAVRVRHHFAGTDRVDEFGRQGDPGDRKQPPLAIHHDSEL